MFTFYGDRISGNCLKVKWTADVLGLSYRWLDVDIMAGDTRTDAFLALNPAGQVPLVVLADGRPLAQSNAIIAYLAEGSSLIPQDAYQRARMFEWLFWEQYSHEPYVAVARFQVRYLGKSVSELEPRLVERGLSALARLETAVADAAFLLGDAPSLADIALSAYTRMAEDGGFRLSEFPQVSAWLERVEEAIGITDPR